MPTPPPVAIIVDAADERGEQRTALRRAGRLEALGEPGTHRPHDGALSLPPRLPRQGVSLLVCTWEEPPLSGS
jgi:hypothetical protein